MVKLEPKLIADLLRQSMNEGRAPYLSVISGSMSPLIKKEDRVKVSSTDHFSLSTGDVVVLELQNELLTHRYWGSIDAGDDILLITKGDRSQQFDHPHDAGTLVGLVIAIKRNGREMGLSEGAGGWMNKGLTALARVDSWLFASPIPSLPGEYAGTFSRAGIFCRSTRNSFSHRAARKMILLFQQIYVLIFRPFSVEVEDT